MLCGALLASSVMPRAMAGDEEGQDLLIGGWVTHNVLRVSPSRGTVYEFIPSQYGGIRRVHDMMLHTDDLVYVCSWASSTIARFDVKTGEYIDDFVEEEEGGLIGPTAIVFGPDGNFYVTSWGTDEVLRYSPEGEFIDVFVSRGSGGLELPHGLRFGPDGNLYVGSTGLSPGILKFDGQTGEFMEAFVDRNTLRDPHYLVFHTDGFMYVCDAVLHAVLRFDSETGDYYDTFIDTRSGGVLAPHGVSWDTDGDLYVPSFGSSELLRFDGLTGEFMEVVLYLPAVGLLEPTFPVWVPADNPIDVSVPLPGRAGRANTFQLHGIAPGERVYILFGPAKGEFQHPWCPFLVSQIANPAVLGVGRADDKGHAVITSLIAPGAKGQTVYYQAIERFRCVRSELMTYTFQ